MNRLPPPGLLGRRRLMMKSMGKYIKFADPVVKQICIERWSSDGIGLTYDDAANVTSVASLFNNNMDVRSFDEFKFFIGVCTDINDRWHYSILSSMCWGAKNLERILLPQGLVCIGPSMFRECYKLTRLDIPAGVKIIYGLAFSGSGLEEIFVRPEVPPSCDGNPIADISMNAKIYVPYSSDHAILNAYKTDKKWSIRADIIHELNPDGTIPDLD